jgi:hypothetical protein
MIMRVARDVGPWVTLAGPWVTLAGVIVLYVQARHTRIALRSLRLTCERLATLVAWADADRSRPPADLVARVEGGHDAGDDRECE